MQIHQLKKILLVLFTVLFYGQPCETAQNNENMAENAKAKSSPA
jgi:hypothetical protein